jgi:uncharacterized membrane protein
LKNFGDFPVNIEKKQWKKRPQYRGALVATRFPLPVSNLWELKRFKMGRENFWSGFAAGLAAGAVAGVAGVLALKRGSSDVDGHIIRLEKSINVGRPAHEVFAAWSNFERLQDYIGFIQGVQRFGQRSHWRVNIDGRTFEWDAQITQIVPNESLGWKSLSGPHHTGRISFAPLGEQTVVHVLMNYEPPLGELGSVLPLEGHLEQWIERGLREFKTALERERTVRTGTTNETVSTGPVGTPGEHSAPGTVSYTRPPQAKY